MWITKFHGYNDTTFGSAKVNEDEINLAVNKTLYILRKRGAQ